MQHHMLRRLSFRAKTHNLHAVRSLGTWMARSRIQHPCALVRHMSSFVGKTDKPETPNITTVEQQQQERALRHDQFSAHEKVQDEPEEPQQKGLGESFASVRRLAQFAEPAKREIFWGLLFLPPALGASLALPLFVGKIVDSIGAVGEGGDIQQMVIMLLGISTAGAVATVGRSYYINLAGEMITKHMRNTLFKSLARKDVVFFDRHKTGDLITRISSDTSIISGTLTESVSMALRGAATMTLGTGFLFLTSWKLALVSTGTLAPIILMSRLWGMFIRKETKKQQETFGEGVAVAEEALSNIRTVYLFQRQRHEAERFDVKMEQVFQLGKNISFYRGVFMGCGSMVMSLSMLSVLSYGASMVSSGALSPGTLTTFLLYAVNVGGAAFQIANVYSSIMRALGAGDRICEITEAQDDCSLMSETGGLAPTELQGEICFKDVSFSYPTRSSEVVFDKLNLTIPPGKVVALLGQSGSGKSTLIGLLARFYDPTSGEISIDGHPLTKLDVTCLRDTLGTVSQDATVFHTSIYDNIRYGNLDATEEQIHEAARLANAHDFIMGFKDGYQALVGERGTALSGGQKQRICIARAILKNPRVLILDEATSALDVHNEWLVQQAMDRLMEGRTTLVITHRLSSINNADYVAVLDDHRVVEFGPRQEMVNNKESRFADLLARSQVGYDP